MCVCTGVSEQPVCCGAPPVNGVRVGVWVCMGVCGHVWVSQVGGCGCVSRQSGVCGRVLLAMKRSKAPLSHLSMVLVWFWFLFGKFKG